MRYKRGHIVKNNLGNVGYVLLASAIEEEEDVYHVRWQFANGHYLGLGEFMTMERESDITHHTLNYNEKVLYND